jgi:predicted RNA methylase
MAKQTATGGIINGQLHSQCNEKTGCGEKFIVNGQQIEAERDEAILTGAAEHAYPNEVFEIQGTIKQIASAINVLGGGQSFAKGAVINDQDGNKFKVQEAQNNPPGRQISGTVYFINRRSMNDPGHYRVRGTVRQIASAINGLHSPVSFAPGGDFFKNGGIKSDDKIKKLIRLLDDPCVQQTEEGIEFGNWMLDKLRSGYVFKSRVEFEKKAQGLGISNVRDVKELTEMAIVRYAMELASSGISVSDTYKKMVEFYNRQPNMTLRTSATLLMQQYSTPTPIAYLLGVFCGFNSNVEGVEFFEPSAGNGMLTVAGNPKNFAVNEIDQTRLCSLRALDFAQVTDQDGTLPFEQYYRKFKAMITNPPFGSMEKMIDGVKLSGLENIMAINALETIKDEGRAAIITGGHVEYDSAGRIAGLKNKVFLNWLYQRYNVVDVINISGNLYAKQGTQFKIRATLINGRRKTEKFYPLAKNDATALDSFSPKQVNNFEELYMRMQQHID